MVLKTCIQYHNLASNNPLSPAIYPKTSSRSPSFSFLSSSKRRKPNRRLAKRGGFGFEGSILLFFLKFLRLALLIILHLNSIFFYMYQILIHILYGAADIKVLKKIEDRNSPGLLQPKSYKTSPDPKSTILNSYYRLRHIL